MSELKAVHAFDVYESYTKTGDDDAAQVYLKSEADKVIADLEESHKMEVEQLLIEIVKLKADYKEACDRLQTANLIKDEQLAAARHHKYKRCLAMAKWCHNQREIYERDSYNWELNNEAVASLRNKANILRKWHKRWLKLAEKFKEDK